MPSSLVEPRGEENQKIRRERDEKERHPKKKKSFNRKEIKKQSTAWRKKRKKNRPARHRLQKIKAPLFRYLAEGSQNHHLPDEKEKKGKQSAVSWFQDRRRKGKGGEGQKLRCYQRGEFSRKGRKKEKCGIHPITVGRHPVHLAEREKEGTVPLYTLIGPQREKSLSARKGKGEVIVHREREGQDTASRTLYDEKKKERGEPSVTLSR